MAKKQNSRPKQSKGKKTLYLIMLAGGLFVFKTTTIFIIIGMMPSIVAYYGDTSKTRLYFRALAAANLAGVIPFAGDMMTRGNSLSGFISVSTQPMTWLTVFGSAIFGSLLMVTCPMLARYFLDLTQQNRIITIEQKQKRIVEEWGEEVQRTGK